MAEEVIQWGGLGALSAGAPERGDLEPDEDPRPGRGARLVGGLHLVSAAERLEPAATTQMAYFDPDAPDLTLEELEEAIQEGRLSLEEVMTKSGRFTPLVNPRRSRKKEPYPETDEDTLPADSDADLWHVPTSNYRAHPPTDVFSGLASAIDANDSVDNEAVYGEFRTRRGGGEVFGEVWFEDFEVAELESEPVRLGFKVGWSYYGDRAFFSQPWAQQGACKNSVAPLDDKDSVPHHNRSVDWREHWAERLRELGLYGDELTHRIDIAQQIIFELGELPDDGAPEDAIPVPMDLEGLYEHLGFPEPETAADHARQRARNSGNDAEGANSVSAWNVHSGATYWLQWHWDGSEDSRAFRTYRRTANDLLFNTRQVVGRAMESYEDEERGQVIRDVLGQGRGLEDASESEREEIADRLDEHAAISAVSAAAETLGEKVEEFEDAEERLNRIQEGMAE